MTLKLYDYRTYAPRSIADIAAQAQLAEQVGFDSVWVMDHVFIQRGERRLHAHDPLLTLAAVAAATSTVTIGSLVLCHAFRHVVQLAREAAALADSSGGRFVLGLGTGWHRPEFDALGLPFDHLVGRLEGAVDPLRGMLRGERAAANGKWLELRDASVAVTAAPPPMWIAAEGPRMLALAARCEGWSHAYWGAEDTSRFANTYALLRDAAGRSHRDVAQIETSAAVACVLDGWDEVPGGFSEPQVAVGPASELARVVRGYAAAGADHVILSLSPDPYGDLDPGALERSAAILQAL